MKVEEKHFLLRESSNLLLHTSNTFIKEVKGKCNIFRFAPLINSVLNIGKIFTFEKLILKNFYKKFEI